MRRTYLAAGLLAVAFGGCGQTAQEHAAAPPPQVSTATTPIIRVATSPKPRHHAVRRAVHHRTHRVHRVAHKAAPAPAPAPSATPAATSGNGVSAGAPSDAQVRAELQQMYGGSGGGSASSDASATATRRIELVDGQAQAPPDAPAAVQAIVAGANQVARLPYVYGGGHGRAGGPDGTWVDSAYDCSGSVSFALATAGLVKSPMDSTTLSHWGAPGPGRWVTIYANAAHAFMVVGGVRFDTVGLQQGGSRWQPAYRSFSGFVARHPPGL